MNVLQLAEALTAETERHESEIARIIAEFTGTARPVAAPASLPRTSLGLIQPHPLPPKEKTRPH